MVRKIAYQPQYIDVIDGTIPRLVLLILTIYFESTDLIPRENKIQDVEQNLPTLPLRNQGCILKASATMQAIAAPAGSEQT